MGDGGRLDCCELVFCIKEHGSTSFQTLLSVLVRVKVLSRGLLLFLRDVCFLSEELDFCWEDRLRDDRVSSSTSPTAIAAMKPKSPNRKPRAPHPPALRFLFEAMMAERIAKTTA